MSGTLVCIVKILEKPLRSWGRREGASNEVLAAIFDLPIQ
jgi:hypothetical protein